MKKILSILILVSSFLIFLTSCDFLQKEIEQQPQQLQISADSLLDNQIYENAVSSKDTISCEKIWDESKKEECKSVVAALALTDKAVIEMDDNYCGDIEIERYKENCEDLVEQKMDEQAAAAKEEEKNIGMTEIAQEAMDQQDLSICEEIEDENIMYSCKKNIIINQVIKTKDGTLCSKLEKEEYIQECMTELQAE